MSSDAIQTIVRPASVVTARPSILSRVSGDSNAATSCVATARLLIGGPPAPQADAAGQEEQASVRQQCQVGDPLAGRGIDGERKRAGPGIGGVAEEQESRADPGIVLILRNQEKAPVGEAQHRFHAAVQLPFAQRGRGGLGGRGEVG